MIKKNRETSPFILETSFSIPSLLCLENTKLFRQNQRSNPQSKSETSRCSQHFWCTACNQDCFEFQQLFRLLPDLCRSHDFVLRRSHNEATRVLQTIPLQAWCVSQHNIWIVRLAEKESQKHILLNEGSISIPSTCSEKWGKMIFGKIFV